MILTTGADDAGRRLDRILRKALPDMPLSGIHRLLRKGRVLVNGKAGAAEDRVTAGSRISVPDRDAVPQPPERATHSSAPLYQVFPLNILEEDADLLFINKPAGLTVHGPESLDDQVRAYLRGKTGPSLSFRPGPLHRLDKPTSGIIVFSKTLAGARSFSALLREGRIKKQYLALVEGQVEEAAVWEDFLIRDTAAQKTLRAGAGDAADPPGPNRTGTAKKALTRIRPLAVSAGALRAGDGKQNFSLILAELETGRTHQIRAQAAARGFPLAGDAKYGGSPRPEGFLLHAWKLEMPGKVSGGGEGRPRTIGAPLPERFRLRLEELFGAALKISSDEF